MLDESLARRLWPDKDPLGQLLRFESPRGPALEVVGIVANSKYLSRQDRGRELFYLNSGAPQQLGIWRGQLSAMSLLLRTRAKPLDYYVPLRQLVHAMDPRVAVPALSTLSERADDKSAGSKERAQVITLLAAIALLLAMTGLFGVVSASVEARRGEIAVRIALGARRSAVIGQVAREGLSPAALGSALGLAAALWLARLLASVLFGVDADDPLPYALATVTTFAAAAVALVVPARRASRIEPARLLRDL